MNDRVAASLLSTNLIREDRSVWHISSELPIHYEVQVVDGLFHLDCDELLLQMDRSRIARSRQILVIDENVHALYGNVISSYYDHHNVELSLLTMKVTEECKNLESACAAPGI